MVARHADVRSITSADCDSSSHPGTGENGSSDHHFRNPDRWKHVNKKEKKGPRVGYGQRELTCPGNRGSTNLAQRHRWAKRVRISDAGETHDPNAEILAAGEFAPS